ncbi:hypothetical protein [Fodinibius sediminis]|uniref:hypothetical protein n=1 Tax=Fodinibius sediminis TaxID=1214077 RepID=UPI00163DD88B|nr:hypothetical protein [Fodinibius sediminis]
MAIGSDKNHFLYDDQREELNDFSDGSRGGAPKLSQPVSFFGSFFAHSKKEQLIPRLTS